MRYFYDCEFLEGAQKKKFWWGNTVPTIDLISIGIVAEDGREYYAISKDFNLKEAWNRYDKKSWHTYAFGIEVVREKDYWIRENVLMPIFFELAEREFHNIHFKDEWIYEGKVVDLEVFKSNEKWTSNFTWFKKLIKKYGKTNKQIANEIENFCKGGVKYFDDKGVNERSNPELYGYYSAYDHVALCWLFGKMIDLPKGFPMYTIDLKQQLDNVVNQIVTQDSNSVSDLDLDSPGFDDVLEYLKKRDGYPKQTNEHNSLSDAKFNFELYKFLKQ